MQKSLLPRLIGSVAGLAMMTGVALAQENVEVLHWWTSGGEAAALNVLKQNLEKEASVGRTCRWPAVAASRP